jgi:hypothetical protein
LPRIRVFGFKVAEQLGSDIMGSLTVRPGCRATEHKMNAPGGYTGTSWCRQSFCSSSNCGSSSAQQVNDQNDQPDNQHQVDPAPANMHA